MENMGLCLYMSWIPIWKYCYHLIAGELNSLMNPGDGWSGIGLNVANQFNRVTNGLWNLERYFGEFQSKVEQKRPNRYTWQKYFFLRSPTYGIAVVGYFEQLLGAARTQKLVELLFFSGFQAFLFILNFFQWFHGWNQNTTTITGLNIFV